MTRDATYKAAYILPSDTEIPAQATQIAQRTQDGLYEINQDMLEYKRAYICETKPSNPLTLWHQRLGHVHPEAIIKAVQNGTLTGVESKRHKNVFEGF